MAAIRRAVTGADISHVVAKSQELRAAVNGPQEIDAAHLGGVVARLMQIPSGVVLVSPGGFIAGEVGCTPINPELIAFELGWFASDRSGISLLNAFEAWARAQGCGDRVKYSTAPDPGLAGKILTRRGCKPAELAWFR